MRIRHDVTRDNANIIAKNRDRIGERKGTKTEVEGARKKSEGKGRKGGKGQQKKKIERKKNTAVLYPGFFKPSNGKTECLTSAKQIEAEAFQPATLNRFDGMAQRCYRFDFVRNIPGEMF